MGLYRRGIFVLSLDSRFQYDTMVERSTAAKTISRSAVRVVLCTWTPSKTAALPPDPSDELPINAAHRLLPNAASGRPVQHAMSTEHNFATERYSLYFFVAALTFPIGCQAWQRRWPVWTGAPRAIKHLATEQAKLNTASR